ncbi:Transcription factor PIF1 [Platanthera guangdongensis]|uniref:Transcription factor PIF1 n=1 Tax=Platanthera guangdongensis TaxID=2320717 RepID=A0ABR2MWA9_9ASPA
MHVSMVMMQSDKASMLDEAIEYLKSLQQQVQIMWMGSGMATMMFPTIQNYMTHMGLGIGRAPMLQLPRVPLVNQPMPTSPSANQMQVCPPSINHMRFPNQLCSSQMPESFAPHLGFHHMQPFPQEKPLTPELDRRNHGECRVAVRRYVEGFRDMRRKLTVGRKVWVESDMTRSFRLCLARRFERVVPGFFKTLHQTRILGMTIRVAPTVKSRKTHDSRPCFFSPLKAATTFSASREFFPISSSQASSSGLPPPSSFVLSGLPPPYSHHAELPMCSEEEASAFRGHGRNN